MVWILRRRQQHPSDFEESEHPTTINESMAPVLRNITQPSLGGNEFIDLDAAAKTSLELESSYDENDLALYALGVGAARDALDKSELKFVYEMGSEFQALPTFGVMPQMRARSTVPSVWPARSSTPPGIALSGNIWPGLIKSAA